MAVIGIRKLSSETSKVIKEFEETGEPVIVTRQGRPIGALVPVDEARLDDLILSTAPEVHASVRRADADFEEGRTRSLSDYARERGIELPKRAEADGDEETEETPPPGDWEAIYREHMRAAIDQELSSLTSVLKEPFALRVVSDASADVGALSRETLAALKEDASAEAPPEQELNEVAEVTAGAYGRVLRGCLMRYLGDEAPDAALAASRLRAKTVVRHWNQSFDSGSTSRSVDDYVTWARAVRVALDATEEPVSSEPGPSPKVS